MRFWTLDNFREVTAGRWLRRPADDTAPADLAGLSPDSRRIAPGQVFCAIAGERFDGHQFIQQAIDAGAAMVMVEQEACLEGVRTGTAAVLLVDKTVSALGRLASAYRRRLGAKVIAVTGSAGKTTTKQMIHAVLASRYVGKASPRSYNNHIGVPLTLLAVEPRDRYVVVEVGSNAPGEIAALGRIVEPDIAIITHVGLAHVEKLGTLADVAREKAALLTSLREGGLAIVNGDIESLQGHLKVAPNLIRFGRSDACDLRLTDCHPTPGGARFTVNGRAAFELPLLGEHNAVNALAAVAAGRHMNLDDDQIAAGLREVAPPNMRLNVRRLGQGERAITIINDAYNANPDSAAAALAVLAAYPTSGRRIAVLGDMLELGQQAPPLHRALGERVTGSGIDAAVFIGRAGLFAAEAAARVWDESKVHAIAAWDDQTADHVASLIRPGDTVLLKGSRAMGLERLVPAIEHRFGAGIAGVRPRRSSEPR